MANTAAYREAENYVRNTALPKHFHQPFAKEPLPVGRKADGSVAKHEFDAVSRDHTVVVSIKALSGKTAGGKNPSGKVKDANAELLFLSLVQASRRLLVLTDESFFRLFKRESDGKRPPGVELLHVPLPQSIKEKVERARQIASREVSPSQP